MLPGAFHARGDWASAESGTRLPSRRPEHAPPHRDIGGATTTRSNLWTVIAIAIVAYAACDMAHEVLGHGVACALTGVRALSLSTVALQTGTSNRLVAAAGSIANVIVGLLALALFRRGRAFGTTRYFLWLFAAVNLMNGTGYLLFSGVLDFGDWAVVIAGLEPHGIWRAVLTVAGAALYFGAIKLVAAQLIPLIRNGEIDRLEMPRLIFPAYVAGGLLFVAGAALNPIGPSLILMSGVSSGFGAMAGLAIIPKLVQDRTAGSPGGGVPLRFSPAWVAAGLLVALVFVAILGPGVRL